MSSYLPEPQGNKNKVEKRDLLRPSWMSERKKKIYNNIEEQDFNLNENLNQEPKEIEQINSDIKDVECKIDEYSKYEENNNQPYQKVTEKITITRSIENVSSNGEKSKKEETKEELREEVTYGKIDSKIENKAYIDDKLNEIKRKNELISNNNEDNNLNEDSILRNLPKLFNKSSIKKADNIILNNIVINNNEYKGNDEFKEDLIELNENIKKFITVKNNILPVVFTIIFIAIISLFFINNTNMEKEYANQIIVQESFIPKSKGETLDYVHSLANSLIIAENGNAKWGKREVNPQNIAIAMEAVETYMPDDEYLLKNA